MLDKATSVPQVVILGAGFAGLSCARRLANQPIEVLLVDRNNFHTFTPLLYQVATCALDPGEIAFPVRSIFQNSKNIQTMMAEVTAVWPEKRVVQVERDGVKQEITFDFLVMALGSLATRPTGRMGGNTEFVLRTLNDAISLRNHVLRQFEKAAWESRKIERDTLLSLVVVGGGPTGIETAGALFELYNHVLAKEFRGTELRARVTLVEAAVHLLSPYPPKLQELALQQLQSLGVDVVLGSGLERIEPGAVVLASGKRIQAGTVVWSTGVRASGITEQLRQPLGTNHRVRITTTLATEDIPNIYVLGDAAYLEDEQNQPYPMMIPPAMQQGDLAGKNILSALRGEPGASFRYRDRGMMATIGRRRAVAYLYNRFAMSGWLAWLVWLVFHLVTLLGFRNRLNVFINWAWNYLTYDRGVRLILD